jgi:hypothetical protein
MADQDKEKNKAARRPEPSTVEIIADDRKLDDEPVLTVRTGRTNGKTFFVKINQPAGRALLVAVHL